MSDTLIVIPARYGSSRFEGKPLVKIAGKELLLRVYENAIVAAKSFNNTDVVVATEDERIKTFCDDNNVPCVMTSDTCKTGTDRVLEAVEKMDLKPEFVINLQGDSPFCPPWFLEEMLSTYEKDKEIQVITPCVRLAWEELDVLREEKKVTPFSGTTCVFDDNHDALWFSKNIMPAIRNEDDMRKKDEKSPVFRHIGLYGYTYDMLKKFTTMAEGYYERIEGLEQLRLLENKIKIKIVEVETRGYDATVDIDYKEDISRAEELLIKQGEL